MLTPTKKQLEEIGFKKTLISADELNPKKTIYMLDGKCNDLIYHNYDEKHIYKWYYQTKLGDISNHIHLSINTFALLYSILSAFGFDYNFKIY